MNNGLKQICQLLQTGYTKRIIFEIKDDNVLDMTLFNNDANHTNIPNKFSFDVINESCMDLLSVVLGNLLLGQNQEDKK